MFELYFGAFDVVLYALAFITAILISGSICDAQEPGASVPDPDSLQSSALSYVSCEPSIQPIATSVISEQVAAIPITEPARPLEITQSKPVLRLSDIRLYKLHQHSVVLLSALSFSIPDRIKRYMLRGEQVVRLTSLQEIATVIA
ncbi:MAG: hypothetical protein AAF703_17870 [Cyanobacteria bacterium P01_D01_bin.105]